MIGERAIYYLSRAVDNIRLNSLASLITMVTLTLCLILLGGTFMLLSGIQAVVPPWMTDVVAVAYLKSEVAVREQRQLAGQLGGWPEIEKVRAVSRKQAWERLQAQLGEWADVLDGLDENPLPQSLEITFESRWAQAGDVDAVLKKIRGLPQVEEVYYGKAWVEKLQSVVQLVRFGAVVVMAGLSLAVVLIVGNTVKLTVLARRTELEIYAIVGATRLFTKMPFYLEGILHGVVSGLAAAGILIAVAEVFSGALPLPVAAALSWKAQQSAVFGVSLIGCGIGLATLGSWFAMRRFLRI